MMSPLGLRGGPHNTDPELGRAPWGDLSQDFGPAQVNRERVNCLGVHENSHAQAIQECNRQFIPQQFHELILSGGVLA